MYFDAMEKAKLSKDISLNMNILSSSTEWMDIALWFDWQLPVKTRNG